MSFFSLFYTCLFYFSPVSFSDLSFFAFFLLFLVGLGIDDWGKGGFKHSQTCRTNAPKCQRPVNNRHKGLSAFTFPLALFCFFLLHWTGRNCWIVWCKRKRADFGALTIWSFFVFSDRLSVLVHMPVFSIWTWNRLLVWPSKHHFISFIFCYLKSQNIYIYF